MKIINADYGYIALLAFQDLLAFEDERTLTFSQISNYRNIMLKYEKLQFSQQSDMLCREIDFAPIDEEAEISKFKEDYKEYFTFKEDRATLKSSISLKEFSNFILNRYQELSIDKVFSTSSLFFFWTEEDLDALHISSFKNQVIELLNIHSIKETFLLYYKYEIELEKLYQKLYTNEDNENLRKRIKALLTLRQMFLEKIESFPHRKKVAFNEVADDLSDALFLEKEEEWIKYISKQACINSGYFEDDELLSLEENVEEAIFDYYQRTVFASLPMYYEKIGKDIEFIKMEDPFGYKDKLPDPDSEEFAFFDFEKFFEEIQSGINPKNIPNKKEKKEENELAPNEFFFNVNFAEEHLILYLHFIKRINDYIEKYGYKEELLIAKRRLLYVLDSFYLCLYDEEKFKEIYESTMESAPEIIDEESFQYLEGLIAYLCDDVFLNEENQYTILKLLDIGTFYDIRQMKEIEEILGKYKNHPKYNDYLDIIFNRSRTRKRKI